MNKKTKIKLEKITHKELIPLDAIAQEKKKFNVDDFSFQKQYLSLDHFYGSWSQGVKYEETKEEYFSDEIKDFNLDWNL